MPLKIPPFTPVPIQPTSAEPFSTFVQQTPLANTPLTGTELVPIIQGGVSKHTPPGSFGGGGSSTITVGTTPVASGTTGFALTDNAGVLGDAPIRTILTANINFYVATTGNDSNNGSLAHPWATLQHAEDFISQNLDIAGFAIYVNIGTGTFAGVGAKSDVGGGFVIFQGTGSGSTIITAGPNDGVFNFGECFSFLIIGTGTVAGIHKLTMRPPTTALSASGVKIGFPDWQVWLSDPTTNAVCDIIFDVVNAPFDLIDIEAPGFIQDQAPSAGGSIKVINTSGVTLSVAVFFLIAGAIYFSGVPWTINAGLTVADFAFIDAGAQFIAGANGTFTGVVTGERFNIGSESSVSAFADNTPGVLGGSYFPGSIDGICSPGASYDGYVGSISGSGLPTTTQFTVHGMSGVYKDTSGGGVYMVYNDAGTIKKVQLT